MGATGSSTRSAAASAVNAVNQAVASPASERYPGAVDPAPYAPGSTAAPGSPGGPVAYPGPGEPFASSLPGMAPDGGIWDSSFLSGHDGPQQAWDSSAGAPFAPSGALNPELHGQDTGGVFQTQYVIPAGIGSLVRHTGIGQTTVRNAETQDAKLSTGPNGRADFDQQQWHNPEGYDPAVIPYAERPIYNNVAYQAPNVTDPGTAYGVAGGLPDRSPFMSGALAYAAPPDPSVPQSAAPSTSGIGGGWV